jgi:hypothetical protein
MKKGILTFEKRLTFGDVQKVKKSMDFEVQKCDKEEI